MGQAAPGSQQTPDLCHSMLTIFITCTQIIKVNVLIFKIRHCMVNFDEDYFIGFWFEVGLSAPTLPSACCGLGKTDQNVTLQIIKIYPSK